jgi:hypothetical protein
MTDETDMPFTEADREEYTRTWPEPDHHQPTQPVQLMQCAANDKCMMDPACFNHHNCIAVDNGDIVIRVRIQTANAGVSPEEQTLLAHITTHLTADPVQLTTYLQTAGPVSIILEQVV